MTTYSLIRVRLVERVFDWQRKRGINARVVPGLFRRSYLMLAAPGLFGWGRANDPGSSSGTASTGLAGAGAGAPRLFLRL